MDVLVRRAVDQLGLTDELDRCAIVLNLPNLCYCPPPNVANEPRAVRDQRRVGSIRVLGSAGLLIRYRT